MDSLFPNWIAWYRDSQTQIKPGIQAPEPVDPKTKWYADLAVRVSIGQKARKVCGPCPDKNALTWAFFRARSRKRVWVKGLFSPWTWSRRRFSFSSSGVAWYSSSIWLSLTLSGFTRLGQSMDYPSDGSRSSNDLWTHVIKLWAQKMKPIAAIGFPKPQNQSCLIYFRQYSGMALRASGRSGRRKFSFTLMPPFQCSK